MQSAITDWHVPTMTQAIITVRNQLWQRRHVSGDSERHANAMISLGSYPRGVPKVAS